MSLSTHQVLQWFTTPEELREIANEMERFWPTCKPGQDKTVHTVYGKTAEMRILVDQDKIKTPGWFETGKGTR
jgi:hypothetical protein